MDKERKPKDNLFQKEDFTICQKISQYVGVFKCVLVKTSAKLCKECEDAHLWNPFSFRKTKLKSLNPVFGDLTCVALMVVKTLK